VALAPPWNLKRQTHTASQSVSGLPRTLRKLGKEALKHAIRATSKISNVLHKSEREIRSGLYLRDSPIRVVKGVVSVAIRTEREHVDAAHVDVEQTPACCEVDVAAEQAAVIGGNPDDTTDTDAAPRQANDVIKWNSDNQLVRFD